MSGGRIPEAIRRRLFDAYDPEKLDEHHDFVALRLMEAGTSAELRWLVERLGEARLSEVFEHRGGRFGRRERAFWSLVLGRDAAPAPEHATRVREATWIP